MSSQLQILVQRWQKLEPRERVLLATMAIVVGLFLIYLLAWRPISNELGQLRISVPKAESALALMRAQSARVKSLKNRSQSPGSGKGILTQLEEAASRRGLRQNITKMEPDGSNGIRLTLENASFNSILSLLSDMQKSAGLRVETATIDPAGDIPGIVNARLLLKGNS